MIEYGTHSDVVEVEVFIEGFANALLGDLPSNRASKRNKERGCKQSSNACCSTNRSDLAAGHRN